MPTSVPAPVASFDFTQFQPHIAQLLREKTEEIQGLISESIDLVEQTFNNYVKMGRLLNEIKSELEHGQWENWVKAFFPLGKKTAERAMAIAINPKSDTMSLLKISATAGAILSSLRNPDEAEELTLKAIELAEKGEKITVERAKEIKRTYRSQPKYPQSQETSVRVKASASTIEIIDAELESPAPTATIPETVQASPQEEQVCQTQKSEIALRKEDREPDEVKALPPSPSTPWWRLSGKEQTHLLFCGHPDSTEFLAQIPASVGIWMGFPPNPNQWLCPPPNRVNTAFSYSTIYPNIDLKAVREAVERVLETSDESDNSAIVAYLPDPPLVVLLEDFNITCYIAEPDVAQCQKILSVWQQLGGEVEKLNFLDSVERQEAQTGQRF
jgi:Protein of unknown function (DUF3102)